ncbi:hypothetical protein Saso_74860 [Streptomyces asoensis]|uniref:Uncharacterized protein n=1 Tax=Streptomyces asoensis TaxID=249586 RepID=A0ABQ3SCI0_9ACTN|nr:hypothetical protein GCM10010496_64080 [Streptomyces asoensis]GHI65836.1 hypothetical protein Saso_74860 [Streptomyces asoensis]
MSHSRFSTPPFTTACRAPLAGCRGEALADTVHCTTPGTVVSCVAAAWKLQPLPRGLRATGRQTSCPVGADIVEVLLRTGPTLEAWPPIPC